MGNVYFITGASSDVGGLLIDRLLSHGTADDIVVAQGSGDLATLAPLCQKYKGKIHTYDVDLTDPAAVELFLDNVGKTVATPTHIIHLPALRVINTKFKSFDEARFSLDLQLQLGSAISICKRFLPLMAKNKNGRVLFMLTSYVLGIPPKYTAAYVMAKDALRGLAKSLSADYASFGITVNCIAPSMMETKFLSETPDLVVQASAEANPMGRNATPADVVPAMEFLLSEEARFITGITLPITGGSAV